MDAIIGRKLGMTQLFGDDGTQTPVTVIEAGPCPVVQVRPGAGGAGGVPGAVQRVQLGFGVKRDKLAAKAQKGHAAKAGLSETPAVLREFPASGEAPAAGAVIRCDVFAAGEKVKVTGITKGRGFQGVVHRHGFGGGPATHGNTRFRKPGSVGAGTDPSRVIKGKRMPGHMGARQRTQVGLTVAKVDAERNLLYVQGAVPGSINGIVTVRKETSR
jgi:large subunit ribosomal protein L3